MNYKISLDPSVTFTRIDGQSVLFSKQTGDCFGLNDTATHLLKTFLESDFEKATSDAAVAFNVPKAEIQKDLDEVVASLEQLKLLTRQPLE